MSEILNNLWQSTVFAVAIALACIDLRRNSPRLRYWLWLAASMKFLIPFSLLVSIGARVQFPPDTPSLHAVTVQQISTYFAPVFAFRVAAPAREAFAWPVALGAIWLSGALFLLLRWARRWRLIHLAASGAKHLPFACPVPVLSSPASIEPGAFGILRPVILLPDGIVDKLTPAQFEAVITHELHHIRYRDNLTAALHMCVETLFWFHPAVWWIGAKLMDERERDCDEAVLRQGSRPGDYARSIVQVCEIYAESPLACASGISGSDLKGRIREIMTWRGSMPITFRGKAVLAAAAVLTASVPFLIGVIRAQTLPPSPGYGYEVAAIHKSAPGETNRLIGPGPQGGWRAQNMPALALIAAAYSVQNDQIIGAPGWASSDCFDIVFTPDKTESALGASPGLKEIQAFMDRNAQRLQAVLRDRFGLVLRGENHDLPIYALVQAKSGHKLLPHDAGKRGPAIFGNGREITGSGVTVAMLAQNLSLLLDRPVHDETGLTGEFDFKLDWTPDPGPPSGATPAGLGALTEQLGLRLESKKGPVQVYVVEKIHPPTEN
jgi:uncharacterized protein (TIGR03435 family)